MRWWVLILITSAFAGCTSDDVATPEDALGTDGGNDVTDENAMDDNGTIGAVVAPLVVSVTADVLNGTAPLLVSFGITAEGATDNATWSIDFGDGTTTNGTILPGNATHTFEAGLFNVTVVVADGANNATAHVSIEALPGGPESGTFVRAEAQTFSGTITLGLQAPTCGVGFQGARNHDWIVPADEDGVELAAINVKIVMSGGTTNIDSDLFFYDPAGGLIKSSTGGSASETVTVAGPLSAGTYRVTASGCVAVQASYSISATADFIAA